MTYPPPNCEWCNQPLDELGSPNCKELCIDCTNEGANNMETIIKRPTDEQYMIAMAKAATICTAASLITHEPTMKAMGEALDDVAGALWLSRYASDDLWMRSGHEFDDAMRLMDDILTGPLALGNEDWLAVAEHARSEWAKADMPMKPRTREYDDFIHDLAEVARYFEVVEDGHNYHEIQVVIGLYVMLPYMAPTDWPDDMAQDVAGCLRRNAARVKETHSKLAQHTNYADWEIPRLSFVY